MKLSLPFGNRELFFSVRFCNRQKVCFGMTNRVLDKDRLLGYVAFADYDEDKLDKIIGIWQGLSMEFDLGEVYFLQTRGDKKHYQVICPVIMKFGELCELLSQSGCDKNFQGIGYTLKSWTLRIFEKDDRKEFPEPVLVYTLSRATKRSYSDAHLAFVNGIYKGSVPNVYKHKHSDLEVHRFYTNNFERRKLI